MCYPPHNSQRIYTDSSDNKGACWTLELAMAALLSAWPPFSLRSSRPRQTQSCAGACEALDIGKQIDRRERERGRTNERKNERMKGREERQREGKVESVGEGERES